MAEIAIPLYKLTEKGIKWCWDRPCEELCNIMQFIVGKASDTCLPRLERALPIRSRCLWRHNWDCFSAERSERKNEAHFLLLLQAKSGTTELQRRRERGMCDCRGDMTMAEISASSYRSRNLVGSQPAGMDAQAKGPQRQVCQMDFGTGIYRLHYPIPKGLRQPRG